MYPSSSLLPNPKKLSPAEDFNSRINSKIKMLSDSLSRNEESLKLMNVKLSNARSFDKIEEDNLRAYLGFKSLVFEEIEADKERIKFMKTQFK